MEETNLNVGFKLFGGAPHTLVETSRETLSVVPEKTDEEVYAQPVKEDDQPNGDTSKDPEEDSEDAIE